MEELLVEYLPIIIFLGLAVGLSGAMVAASFIVGPSHPLSLIHISEPTRP